jgi:hypothetical protein
MRLSRSRTRWTALVAVVLLAQLLSLAAVANIARAATAYSSLSYQMQVSMSWHEIINSPYYTDIQGSLQFSFSITLQLSNEGTNLVGNAIGTGTYSMTWSGNSALTCTAGNGNWNANVVAGTYANGTVGFNAYAPYGDSGACYFQADHLIDDLMMACFDALDVVSPETKSCTNFPITGGSHTITTNPGYGVKDITWDSISGTAQLTLTGSTVTTISTTASTTLTVTCSPTSVKVGALTTCNALVTGSSPTGTVTWSASGEGNFSATSCTLV